MEQTDDFFVPHVVECTMEEIIEAVRLTPQRCVQEQSVLKILKSEKKHGVAGMESKSSFLEPWRRS